LNELLYLRAAKQARGFMFTGRHENPHIAWPTIITRAKRVGRLVRSVTMRGGAWPLGTLPSSACARQATPLAAEEEDRSDIGCVIRHHGHKLSSELSRGQRFHAASISSRCIRLPVGAARIGSFTPTARFDIWPRAPWRVGCVRPALPC
jgi:hypothetical protein